MLIAAARRLFTERGYAATSTPEIAATAGVTRGALYHHFEDKAALFRAVIEQEAAAVADEIERAATTSRTARTALHAGSDAYLMAMTVPGRTRLLLLDGPAVLGRAEMDAVDLRHAGRTLHDGIADSAREGAIVKSAAEAVATLLSAAFDRAALAIEGGAALSTYRAAIRMLIDGLFSARSK